MDQKTWTVVYAVLVVFIAYCIYHVAAFLFNANRRRRLLAKLPGSEAHWLYGHFKDFNLKEGAFDRLRQKVAEFPRIQQLKFSPFLTVVSVAHTDTVKVILKTTEPKPSGYGPYMFMKPWLGNGLLLNNGKQWHRNRHLLTPAFHFENLRPYVGIYNKTSDVFLSKVDNFALKKEYFEIFEPVTLLTLDILLHSVFSHESNCQTDGQSHPFTKAIHELTEGLVQRLISPWLYPDFLYNFSAAGKQFKKNCQLVHTFAENIIQNRKKTLEENGTIPAKKGKYADFLDILLTARDENNQGLTEREIRDEVDTFLLGGHDTTASGISWCLYSLARHPEYQAKCQEEIDEILQGRDSDIITWEDLASLKYVTMCIKESLRLHTPIVGVMRQVTKDIEIDGYLIPEGTTVEIMPYMLHHNPTVWDNSTEYRPDRFSSENLLKMDSFSFIPFSAGPRNCIGQNFAMNEMKVVIARILRRFDLELDPDHVVGHFMAAVTKAENGIRIRATPRPVVSSQ